MQKMRHRKFDWKINKIFALAPYICMLSLFNLQIEFDTNFNLVSTLITELHVTEFDTNFGNIVLESLSKKCYFFKIPIISWWDFPCVRGMK